MRWRNGQSLLELLLAIAIFLAGVSTLAALFIDANVSYRKGLERAKATQLAQEGIEAARSIRDQAWAGLAAGTYGVTVTSTGLWEFTSTSDTTDGLFTRQIQLAASGTDAYRVTSTVSWAFSANQTATTTYVTVLTNWRQASSGGSTCSWVSPVQRSVLNLAGTGDGMAVVVTGTTAYVGLLAAAAPEFNIIDISSSTNPILVGSLQIDTHITALAVTGTYAYAGSSANGSEINVINIATSTAPTAGTTLNLAGNGDVTGLKIVGTRLYVSRTAQASNPTFEVLDLTNPASPSVLGGLNTGADATRLDLASSGTPWAYLASGHNSQELQTVNATDPTSMGVGGSLDYAGSEDAQAAAVSGTTVYLGSLSRASAAEFQTIDVSSPTLPASFGGYEMGADINGVRTQNAVVLVASASTTREFAVMDVSSVSLPTLLSGLNLVATPNAVDAASCRAVVVTGDNSNEVIVIDGQ